MTSMTLFEALRESHDVQRSLCRKLVVSKASEPQKRLDIFMALKIELEAHAASEERFLYAPLLMVDGGLSSSRHALSEHHEIEELLEEMSIHDKSSTAWLEKAKKLSETVRHHLKEEEKKFFQLAGRLLTDAQKKILTGKYLRDVARMRKVLAS